VTAEKEDEKGEDKSESAVRISLIDVIYGIVLGYSFQFFEQAHCWVQYVRLLFAFAIIVIDWLYVHKLYWGAEYNHDRLFVLDIFILFLFFRMTCVSTSSNPTYWLYLSIIFCSYVIWDEESHRLKLDAKSDYHWHYSLVADSVSCVFYFVFYFFIIANKLESNISRITIGCLFYVIATRFWRVPKDAAQRKKYFRRLTLPQGWFTKL
jgi:hypothetical protein